MFQLFDVGHLIKQYYLDRAGIIFVIGLARNVISKSILCSNGILAATKGSDDSLLICHRKNTAM